MISVAALRGNCRLRHFVNARTEFVVYAYNTLGKSSKQIGIFLNRDHSSIIHLLRRHARMNAEVA